MLNASARDNQRLPPARGCAAARRHAGHCPIGRAGDQTQCKINHAICDPEYETQQDTANVQAVGSVVLQCSCKCQARCGDNWQYTSTSGRVEIAESEFMTEVDAPHAKQPNASQVPRNAAAHPNNNTNTHPPTRPPTKQPTNQPIDQATNRTTNQPTNQPLTNQPASHHPIIDARRRQPITLQAPHVSTRMSTHRCEATPNHITMSTRQPVRSVCVCRSAPLVLVSVSRGD